jgi:release factor glutamine methyltransferase
VTADRVVAALTVGGLLDEMQAALERGGVSEPLAEAREIVAALYDVPRFWPVLNGAVDVDESIRARAQAAVARRVQGAPLAYAVGRASFRHLTLDVDERVLIPRPETELLVDLVLEAIGPEPGGIAIDVGTGSGAIAIALAAEGPFSRVYGTDVSLDAIAAARRNVGLGSQLLRAPVELMQGSLLGPLLAVRARAVGSTPPYIALDEAPSLPAAVRDWEPAVALYSGSDGMAATARLVRQAAEVLAPGGLLAIEVDARRASLAAELVGRERRFAAVRVELDLTGRERFVLARRNGSLERNAG